ncbi:MAG: NADH oxidase, partial [Pseudomonadota bacterium]
MSLPDTYTQMLSTLREDGTLQLALVEKPMPALKAGQILVKVEATPINPSDHGVMFGWANMAAAQSAGSGKDTVLTAPVPEQGMRMMKARIGQPLPVGNEGAGTVVAAGDGDYAQSLIGRTVAVMGGGMYGEYRAVDAMMALPLHDGNTAKEGASSFVNP